MNDPAQGRLHAAEFVLPGHPDKLCDAIADTLVAEATRRERRALVGVEVAVHRNRVFVTGRIGCHDAQGIDVTGAVQAAYRSAGYDRDWRPAPDELVVETDLCLGPLEDGEAEFRALADDQAICTGYANDIAQAGHLPVEHWLAGQLARRLHALRADEPGLGLGPDGKVIVLVREHDHAWSLEAFSCSLQQKAHHDSIALHRAVRLALIDELERLATTLPGLSPALPRQLAVNGAGTFEVGGPAGDNGLSGKKLVMDAYGPRVPIGGGAWSGKDFFKADRAGALHARRLARFIVQLGLASEALVTLQWSPGDHEASLVDIRLPPGETPIDRARIAASIDLSLVASGEGFAVDDLPELARWGHFADPQYPWEQPVRV